MSHSPGGRSSSYVYVELYRLTNEALVDAVNGNYTASYSYDTVGNRTSSVINGITTGYSYDDNDRVLSSGGDSYSYDANGNTVSKTESGVATTSVYDKRNKLVSNTTGGVTTGFDYDIDGLRIERVSGGATTSFITDNNRDYTQVVAEVTNGEFAKGYSYGDDLISQVFPGGSVFFYHYDGLGSTRSLGDNTGTFTDEYDYEAFGELLNSSGSTDNDYLYTGEQYDNELDNYYLRARYYDQGIGRFTQMDTFQGVNNQPVTLHKYLYGNVDPVNGVDPSGNMTLLETSVTSNILSSTLVVRTSAAGVSFIGGFTGGDYFNNNGEFHRYEVTNTICETIPSQGQGNCNLENVFEGLLRYPAPFMAGIVPVYDSKITTLNLFGPVTHKISGFSVSNVTKQEHLLHPGTVERRVEKIGTKIVIRTEGFGTGPLPLTNIIFSDPLWFNVDRNIKNFVERN